MNFLRKARGANHDESNQQDQSAYERRRQQVRRAQRNHRERKQNYIAALEQEVVNLRRQNQQNIREYENEISMLHGVIASSGLSPPTRQARIINAPDIDADVYYPSSYTVSKPEGLGRPLHLHCPPGTGRNLNSTPATQSLEPAQQHLSSLSIGPPSGLRDSASPGSRTTPASSEEPPTLADGLAASAIDKIHGIEFVLALEHPCMHHPDMTRDEFGSHSHMASHNLLSFAPHEVSGAASWEVPGADIERLLNLSTSFRLQGEITPVQAWFRLKQHPMFKNIGEPQLARLRQLLSQDVKCYGFGSVMEESIWLLAVEEIFNQAA